jgi:hypothetical protein
LVSTVRWLISLIGPSSLRNSIRARLSVRRMQRPV